MNNILVTKKFLFLKFARFLVTIVTIWNKCLLQATGDGYGSHSSYGHSGHASYSSSGEECCPLVLDPLLLAALLGAIAAATYFLQSRLN